MKSHVNAYNNVWFWNWRRFIFKIVFFFLSKKKILYHTLDTSYCTLYSFTRSKQVTLIPFKNEHTYFPEFFLWSLSCKKRIVGSRAKEWVLLISRKNASVKNYYLKNCLLKNMITEMRKNDLTPPPPPPTIKPSLNSVTTADVQGQTLVFAIKKEMNLLDFDK